MFEKTLKFWAGSYKNASNPPTYLTNTGCGHKAQSLSLNRAPKMREIQQFFFRLRLVSKSLKNTNNPQSKPL